MSNRQSANIIGPIVYAVSHRDIDSETENRNEADRTAEMIWRLEPGDAMEELLAAQVIGLNEVFSAVLHDFLNGRVDPMKLKAQASIVNIAKVTQGHVDRLKQLKKKRTEAAAPPAPPTPREKPEPKPAAEPQPAAAPERKVEKVATLASLAPDYKRPEEPESWVDGPFVQWLEETPADEARANGLLPAEAPPGTEASHELTSHLAEKFLGQPLPDFAAAAGD